MKIDTLGLQAFIAVVDYGTFGKAAQMLHISQTALSHRVKSLETQLAARLIDRTTRTWSLTPVGEMFFPKAKRLMEELHESFKDVRHAAERGLGSVTVASVSTIASHLLPDAVLEYSRCHPANRVRILEMASPAVMDAVLQRRADFGINVLTRRHPELQIDPVYEDTYVLICRDDHPLAGLRKARWHNVEGQSIVALGHGSANGLILNKVLTELGLEVKTLHEVQRSTTALALAASGLDLAILPKLALRPGMYPRLRAIPLAGPVMKRELALIRRKNAVLPPAAQALYETVRDGIKGLNQRRSKPAAFRPFEPAKSKAAPKTSAFNRL